MIWFSSSLAGSHESWLRRNCLCLPIERIRSTIQSSSLTGFERCYTISRYRIRLMYPGFSTRLWATETQSLPSNFGPRGTIFRRGYSYTPLSSTVVTAHVSPTKNTSAPVPDSIRNLMTTCRKNLLHGLDIANPFPPDLWSYAHRFGHRPECLIVPLAYYDPLKVWQISLRRILRGFEHRFGHKLQLKSSCLHTLKAQSLKPTLSAIIFVCRVTAGARHHQKKAGVQKPHKIYEMYEMYEMY